MHHIASHLLPEAISLNLAIKTARDEFGAFYQHPPGTADRGQLPSEETWYYTIQLRSRR
jgi:hypothetical protein